jgi:predicted RNA binding protein YcfA (HicA-like mRNA interferase family)
MACEISDIKKRENTGKNNLEKVCLLILIFVSLNRINQMNIDIMKYSELERKLKLHGCHFVRNGRNHPAWFSPSTGKEFDMSYHRNEEVKKGTLKSILTLSGVKI